MKLVKTTGWSTFRKLMLFLMFVSVMTFTSIPGYSQTKMNVTGSVKDAETGEPLIGVGIKVKDINYGVITDLDGKYSIDLEEGQDVLIYTYIGYETQEVEVKEVKESGRPESEGSPDTEGQEGSQDAGY